LNDVRGIVGGPVVSDTDPSDWATFLMRL